MDIGFDMTGSSAPVRQDLSSRGTEPRNGTLLNRALVEPVRLFFGDRWFALAIALAIACSVATHILILAVGPAPVILDLREYWAIGGQVATGDLWMQRDAVPYRTPLYLVFLGLFQFIFDQRALCATVVAQHVLVLGTSILAGCLSVQLCRQRWAFLLGYALSAMCLARTWYANTILSESLFTFLLTLTLVVLVKYLDRPFKWGAVVLGGLLGLTILTRAAAQLYWVPLAGLIWIRVRLDHSAAERMSAARQVIGFLLLVGLLLAPWIVRNQLIFGELFLAKNLPRTRWNVCFQGGSAPRLPIPQDEAGRQLVDALDLPRDAISGRHVSFVEKRLREAGLSQEEINGLLKAVCNRAIRENPGRFAYFAFKRFVNYWRCSVDDYPFFAQRTIDQVPADSPDYPADQVRWRWDRLASISEPVLARVPFRSLRFTEFISFATFVSLLLMLRERRTRFAAVGFGLTFLYFSSVTATVVIENYRYRMVLEPAMAAILAFGIIYVAERCRRMRAPSLGGVSH